MFQDTYGQQDGFNVKPGNGLSLGTMGCQQQALQRKSGLISNPSILSQLAKPSAMGCSCNLNQQNGNLNIQQTGFQQISNCQQSGEQQQNLQLSHLQSLPINLQQQLLQQQQSIPMSNWQTGQQPQLDTSDISFSSLPIVNGQISNLPSQVSQGVFLSNLGLSSSLPAILPNFCNCKQQNELPTFVSQNSLSQDYQFASFPASVSSTQPNEFTNPNNQAISFTPITFQNRAQAQTNVEVPQNSVNIVQNQPPQNQMAFSPLQLQQFIPLQSQTMSNNAQLQQQSIQSVQNQHMPNSVQLESHPMNSMQSKLMSNNVQLQAQSLNSVQNKPMPNPTQGQSQQINSVQSQSNNAQLQQKTMNSVQNQPVPNQALQSQPITSVQSQTLSNNEQLQPIQKNSEHNQPMPNPFQLQSQPISSVQSQPIANNVQFESQRTNSAQSQPLSNPIQLHTQAINSVQNQPISSSVQSQSQQMNLVQRQALPNLVQLQPKTNNPVQSQPIVSSVQRQSQPTNSLQNKPVMPNPAQIRSQSGTLMQNQPATNFVQGDPSVYSLFSQMQSQKQSPPNPAPSAFSPSSFLNSESNNIGSKSSSIKALLPLLFNILKEKNAGCECPTNCGPQPCEPCGVCNNIHSEKPEISDGYSNLKNYDRRDEDASYNDIESEETSKARQRKKYNKFKYRYDDSLESTEAEEEYDVYNED